MIKNVGSPNIKEELVSPIHIEVNTNDSVLESDHPCVCVSDSSVKGKERTVAAANENGRITKKKSYRKKAAIKRRLLNQIMKMAVCRETIEQLIDCL